MSINQVMLGTNNESMSFQSMCPSNILDLLLTMNAFVNSISFSFTINLNSKTLTNEKKYDQNTSKL